MKKLYLITLLSLMLCVSCTKKAETDPEVIAMRGLVNRVVPEYFLIIWASMLFALSSCEAELSFLMPSRRAIS